ncbi:hypothetical protein AB0J72_13650 [Dactylosporangium sp. NPDC049742]|uniref:hypothetical protein n=1 Tax=Dactylosporangium sp. NPDC049742 TaxID=3154737 RepID=UPI0034458F87
MPENASQDVAVVDVSDISLTAMIDAAEDSPLVRSMRRLQSSLSDPNSVLSAFGSFIAEA